MTFELKESEKRIGYTFRNKELLITAFTHSTYANVHGGEDNERLEFLGDSVLQMVVSEALYFRKEKDRVLREGEMTVLRQMMVRKEALLDAVERLGLKDFLLIEGGEANVGDKTVSSLFETVTAAIYLDSGYRAAKKFISDNLVFRVERNFKGELQELLQKRGEHTPQYVLEKEGKDNNPLFVCHATASGVQAEGSGRSKAAAEQAAAKELLEILTDKRE